MKLIGWAIALAAAGMTPAAAQAAQATAAASPTAAPAPAATAPAVAAPTAAAPTAGAAGAAQADPKAAPWPVLAPTPGIGVPDGRMGIQQQVTGIGREAQSFHDNWLLMLCGVISIFVLALLGYTMVRFRRSVHPEPSRTTHNTTIEVVWTLIPVLILVAIAIPSIRLLRHQYTPPKADLTVKVIGNQWYWTYQYPDNGDFEIVSNMLKEKGDVKPGERFRTDADGPPLLAADERMVIPAGKVVKFIVTSNDVIHSFGIPALWQKMDANPGQLNETWAKVDRPGVYFGQCSELCGARHGFMPIVIEAVSPARFAQWVALKGGTMPGAHPAPATDSTGSSPMSAAAVPAVAQSSAGSPAVIPAALKQPATNQPATAQN
ncbi:MAG: cytochrome c oxidase subunit II [Sphingomicrobium sp.]